MKSQLAFFRIRSWWCERKYVSLPRLLLIIGAFGCQSSMKCVAIISCSVSSLSSDGVTLRSGGSFTELGKEILTIMDDVDIKLF